MLSINVEAVRILLQLNDENDLTASCLANAIGISRTQAWRIIAGESPPGVKFITKFFEKYPDAKFEDYFFYK